MDSESADVHDSLRGEGADLPTDPRRGG